MKNKLIALLVSIGVLGFILLFTLAMVSYPLVCGLSISIIGSISLLYFAYKITLDFLETRRSR